jgi:hypothetical protein
MCPQIKRVTTTAAPHFYDTDSQRLVEARTRYFLPVGASRSRIGQIDRRRGHRIPLLLAKCHQELALRQVLGAARRRLHDSAVLGELDLDRRAIGLLDRNRLAGDRVDCTRDDGAAGPAIAAISSASSISGISTVAGITPVAGVSEAPTAEPASILARPELDPARLEHASV